jgi:NADH:ubiquinone oxidoreductase subunit 5 (subunit L)/multisubunit Na+/H+ antiporter MnhA subunit
MLFLAVAGIVARTGTRLMYQMGGLIKQMPFSFVSVLVAIIAVSGVPPLAGFGGKWMLYTALLEQGWHLQASLALFSGGIAFLYLFRLIHSIFLGQRKSHHDAVTEAPVTVLIPQFLFLAMIIAVSMFPNLLIQPLQAAVEPMMASTIRWDGYTVISSLGYWNGNAVMYVVMGVFIVPLIWLLAVKGRTYKVEQFNIVYAAERPHTPQSTHYAYNFYGHYRKAFGRLLDPWVERFWGGVSATTGTISQTLRSWNTGNPQTYAFQIVLYLLLTYLVVRGGL